MFSHFFIDRPVLATVLSVVIVIVGAVALVGLPIAQYPEIAPPTVSVTAFYPGANAKVVAETVATPIEQEVNGVENMLYMSSRSTNDGQMSLDVTFEVGTNLDMAQVLVQNRVAIATPRLPEEVRRQGVVTKKRSSSILLAVNMISPDGSKDQLYLSNFAAIQIKDALARMEGVGDVMTLGARDYSMRVWLDPNKLSSRDMSIGDVVRALREQNVQVAAGRVGAPPIPNLPDFQLTVNTQGRLVSEEQFADIIIKTGEHGEITRIKDVARVELGARNYDVGSTLDGKPSALLAVFPTPGSNAVTTAHLVKDEMKKLKATFPDGVGYEIVYDTTVFVEESIADVQKTLFEAFVLVFIVVLIFLQSWRATILPMIEVPVSLIGTFGVMALLGFSLNNLSLFGLVLAIGIVVDDAIVVIENVERWLATGMTPRDATRKAMEEVTGPVIAIALVLSAVFIPTGFITGISGQFYRQFALTIAASTIISAFNALTMTPARCALILKAHKKTKDGQHHHDEVPEVLPWWGVGGIFGWVAAAFFSKQVARMMGFDVGHGGEHGIGISLSLEALQASIPWWTTFFVAGAITSLFTVPVNRILGIFLKAFNYAFDVVTSIYGRIVAGLVRISVLMVVAYAGLMTLTYLGFKIVPGGFIPDQDQGYVIVNATLPEGANLDQTEAVLQRVNDIAMKMDGIIHTVGIPGFSAVSNTNVSNVGGMFITLAPFSERRDPKLSAQAIVGKLMPALAEIEEANVQVFNAPPVSGIGNAGGAKMQIQDRGDWGLEMLQGTSQNVMGATMGSLGKGGVIVFTFSAFSNEQPQIYLEVDRSKAKSMGVPLSEVFDSLQGFLGSAYANDLTLFGRNWQVNVQADAPYRMTPEDIGKIKVRSVTGKMVPLDTLIKVEYTSGPATVFHYNTFPSADVTAISMPGTSSGQALAQLEKTAAEILPQGMTYEWTELSLQEKEAGNTAIFVFVLGTVFVFLVLAGQYESWTLPMAVVLIVPMCLFAAIGGVFLMRMDNNIFTQIGLVVLIGLASKNAILIVEFAKQLQDTEGRTRSEAAIEASRLRLRPILMTSLAFILGVVPLVTAVGAGAEMRRALGVAVFSGMLGVTLFGIFFTPVFYVVVRWLTDERDGDHKHHDPRPVWYQRLYMAFAATAPAKKNGQEKKK